MTRSEFINRLIRARRLRSYLEIGVGRGECLSAVEAEWKLGVDPDPAVRGLDLPGVALYVGTSDEFFQAARGVGLFDLVFIDGLHHCEQVYRDVLNALDVLGPDGVVVVHDCNPTSEEMQRVPAVQGEWTGDCWKAIVKLRATRDDLDISVLDVDYGLGVVQRGRGRRLELDRPAEALTWDDLRTRREHYLNLVPENDAERYLAPSACSSSAVAAPNPETVVRDFHRLYYQSLVWGSSTTWMGVPALKCPLDLWMYQQILHDVRPQLVVELGTAHGGTTLFLAHVLDCLGEGEVLSIDVQPQTCPEHPRITYLAGSSVLTCIVDEVRRRAARAARVLVIADSDHRCEHVSAELEAYGALVTPGSYFIVEDTNLNGRPVLDCGEPGPYEAVRRFLERRSDFVADRSREQFLLSFNPSGYLRRVC